MQDTRLTPAEPKSAQQRLEALPPAAREAIRILGAAFSRVIGKQMAEVKGEEK